MNVGQSFRLALKSLATSKMRALLTMLGIIIGVAAVIIIISLGDGMKKMVDDEFNKMGANLLQVEIMGRGTSQTVKDDEMYALAAEYPQYISAISPNVPTRATFQYDGKSDQDTSPNITGVGEGYSAVKALTLTAGRFIQYIDIERLQNVCVIGSYVDREAFNGAGLGKTVYLNGNPYQVVGVLEMAADNTSYGTDNAVYIPYTNATRLNSNANITSYLFTAADDTVNAQAKTVIEGELDRIFEDDDAYQVISMSEMMSMMGSIQDTMMTVLVAIAAISLLVGGIGIMNIMLVSVTERTREIGIRKSLGAKGKDIRSQFIIEAGTTSAIGGLIGIALGVLLAGIIGNAVNVTAVPSPTAIVTSAGVSLAVGVLFGYLPANKAAKLNPIDALRYD